MVFRAEMENNADNAITTILKAELTKKNGPKLNRFN